MHRLGIGGGYTTSITYFKLILADYGQVGSRGQLMVTLKQGNKLEINSLLGHLEGMKFYPSSLLDFFITNFDQ